jgi:hypothetical protein
MPSHKNLRYCAEFGRNVAKIADSTSVSMEYGFGMNSARLGWPNLKLFALSAVLPLVPLIVVGCGDGDEGFKEDPRAAHQPGGNERPPDPSEDFTADARAGLQPIESDTDAEPAVLPGRMHGDRTYGIWPQVWSQHAPSVQSWEYKVNCGDASSHTEPCFLSDLTSVMVTTPTGDLIALEKDFNTSEFSGDITRRWVLYGPDDGDLPERGDYVFSYSRGDELMYEQVVPYDSGVMSYPTGVEWKRSGRDLIVNWDPPSEAEEGMTCKAIVWQVEDTPELFISEQFERDDSSGELRDVPMIVGGMYSLNVAIFFDDGYAYSDYVIFEWPEPGDTGY